MKYTAEEAIRIVRDKLYENWNSDFIEISKDKGKFFASIFPNVPRKPWYMDNHNLSPDEVKLINRLLTGHTFGNMFLFKIGVLDSILCSMCNVTDDPNHTIFSCQKYGNMRSGFKFFDCHDNIFSLLKSGDFGVYKSLCEFLRNAKINL